ncbi:MAG: hypothetical protein IT342_23290 [Candidatus Melainabacteria bacterium]|nr:hypothetical protein [Candidatus Melainabacteria bacterium]
MENTQPTSLGGLRPTGQQASLLDLGGKGKDDSLVIVGVGPESPGSSVDIGGELDFLKKASDLQLYASVVPAWLAYYDVVIDGPAVLPPLSLYFDKVAAGIMRSIAQDMGLEVVSAKVDSKAVRLTMRLRCIPLQIDLLQHRYPETKATLVMDEPAADEAATTGEGGQTAA